MIRQKIVNRFPWGTVNTIEDRAIPAGAASRALNWLSIGDRIELRRGYALMGADDGVGAVTGIHTTVNNAGTQILYKTYARKVKYYNTGTSAFTEVGSNMLPAAASGEQITFGNYASLAGTQMFFSSPNSGLYKIMTANPGSYTDLTDGSKNFKGFIQVFYNRLILWGRTADKTGIYGSYIDAAAYTTATAETRGSGDGVTTTFTGTLSFKGGGATRTSFAVTFTDGTETFSDNYSGVLTGSAGGTGTINYTSGAYSITFAVAPILGVNNITATYQWENSNNTGLGDFSKSSPRTAGQGFAFRQDDGGGDTKSIQVYQDVLYCLHKLRTWALTLSQTDTNATNLPFRDRVGLPNLRAAVGTGDGVYYVDDVDQNNTQLRLLSLNQIATQVIPTSVSKRVVKGIILGVDLSDYRFDAAATIEWGDYIVFACRTSTSTVNNRVILYNKKSGAIDTLDYTASCFAIYNGALVAGDSITNNVYTLFSGWADGNANITNYWETELSSLETEYVKKTKQIRLQGLIQSTQSYLVEASIDNGSYVQLGTIQGNGSYVDIGGEINIGSHTLGSTEIGGGGSGENAFNYEHAFPFTVGKFQEVKLRFTAQAGGYVSIHKYTYHDIRTYTKRLVSKYR